jgi:hypothetical protein
MIEGLMSTLLARCLTWFVIAWLPLHASAGPLVVMHCDTPASAELAPHAADAHVDPDRLPAEAEVPPSESPVPDDDGGAGDRNCCAHLTGFISASWALPGQPASAAPVFRARGNRSFLNEPLAQPPRS